MSSLDTSKSHGPPEAGTWRQLAEQEKDLSTPADSCRVPPAAFRWRPQFRAWSHRVLECEYFVPLNSRDEHLKPAYIRHSEPRRRRQRRRSQNGERFCVQGKRYGCVQPVATAGLTSKYKTYASKRR